MSVRTAFAHIAIAIASVVAAGCTRAPDDATPTPQPRTPTSTLTPIPISMASGMATPGPKSFPFPRPSASPTPRPTPTPPIPTSPLFVDGPAHRVYASGPLSGTARLSVFDTRDGRLFATAPLAMDERLLDIDREGRRLYVYRAAEGVRVLDADTLDEVRRVGLPTPGPEFDEAFRMGPVWRPPRLPVLHPITHQMITLEGSAVRLHDGDSGAVVDSFDVELDGMVRPITNGSVTTDGQLLYLALADADLAPWDAATGNVLVSLDLHTHQIIERRNLRATISGWLAWDRSLVVGADVYKDIGVRSSLWVDGHEQRRITGSGLRWLTFDTHRQRLVGSGDGWNVGDEVIAVARQASLDLQFLVRTDTELPLTAYDDATDAYFGRSADPDRLRRVPAASLAPVAAAGDVPAPRRTMYSQEAVLSAVGADRKPVAVTGGFAATPGAGTPTPVSGGDEWIDTVTRDGGATWTLKALRGSDWPFGIVAAPRTAGDAEAAGPWFGIRDGIGVVRSVDAGRSWQPASAGIDALEVMDIDVSPDFAHDRTLYATSFNTASADAADDDPTASAWRSRDGGERWEAIGRYAALALSPDFARDRMVIAFEHLGGRCFLSTDGGDRWSARGRLPVDAADEEGGPFAGESWIIPAVAGRPRIVLTVASGGTQFGGMRHWPEAGLLLFRSTDDGATWERVYPADRPAREHVTAADSESFSSSVELLGETAGTWVLRADEWVTGILLSHDGGLTWQRFHFGDDPLASLLAVQPGGRVLVGGYLQGGLRTETLDSLVPGAPPDWRQLLDDWATAEPQPSPTAHQVSEPR